jgi:hypothetical protein
MKPAVARRLSIGLFFLILGTLIAVGLIWSRGNPLSGGLWSGGAAGLLIGVGHMVWRPAPKVALGLAGPGLLILAALAGLSPAALGYGAGAAAVAFGAWYLLVEVWALGWVNRERVSPVTGRGGSGSAGRALVVYHSVAGQFQPAVERALAEGLKTQGWCVDLTTASRATPTDLSPYRLLVLGAPTFAQQPARPILAYLKRLVDLGDKPVLLVVSGQGQTAYSRDLLRKRVAAANGRIVDAIEIWTERDNAELHGLSDPVAILRREGEQLRVA